MRLLISLKFLMIGFILLLSGCSNLDNRPEPIQRPAPRPAPPVARVAKPILPKIPEIKVPVAVKPHRYKRAPIVRRPPLVKPKYQYKRVTKPKYKAPIVQRYPRPSSVPIQTTTPMKPASKTIATLPDKEVVDIDPYANIPENVDDKGSRRSKSSPAVEALLVRAYADAKLGRTDAAMIKLERGLRIEPQNPKLWNQLAELHYKKGNYQQAITMAKKAINLSSNDQEMTDKNWQFLSKVAEKSGNSQMMSEVNEYNKRH